MTHTIANDVSATRRPLPWKTIRRWSIALFGLSIAIYVGILAVNWPFTEGAMIQTLEARSLRKVTIEHFRRTYFPPGCVADGVRFLRIKHPDKPALLTIRQLVVEASYPTLLLCRRRLSNVRLVSLHLQVPAKEPAGEPSPVMPLTYSEGGGSVAIGTITADGAVLDFLSDKSGVQPLRLIARKIVLRDVGSEGPLTYQTEIYNPRPEGEIRSSGTWGPWDPHHPGTTALKGTYEYRNVKLSSLPKLNGMLHSQGSFSGTLAQINAGGDVSVSDFKIGDARRGSQLRANFQVDVDATSGDVELKQVAAWLNSSALVLRGSVSRATGQPGMTITLAVNSNKARVEDLLELFSGEDQPPMTGNLGFRGNVSIPPGEAPLVDRMSLNGTFGIDAGLFSDKSTEREMAKLSVSAIRGDKEEDRENPQTVLLNVKGSLEAARVDQLSFDVPGAHAKLSGTFSLTGYQSNLHGVLMTGGDVADATTGIKSVFLKALTPFFRHHKHDKIVPFKVTGPLGKTTVSLDLGSKMQ